MVQVDSVLLSHPKVGEAVAFAAPDEKFGEVVAAAIVPSSDIGDKNSFIQDLKKHAGSKLAKFKVGLWPDLFMTVLPKAAKSIAYLHMTGTAVYFE